MSSIKTFKIFPVPVFECQIDNHKQINTELEEYIYELKKNDPKGVSKSNAGGWHSDDFIIKDNVPIQNFISKFNNLLPKIFINQMGVDKKLTNIKILNMWSVVNGKNTFNTKHNHPNSYFSAAYYIKTNEDSGHIKFFDPKNGLELPLDKVISMFTAATPSIRAGDTDTHRHYRWSSRTHH